MNKKVYFNQADTRWASHPYPSPSLRNATIKSGGCGPTSSAMLISSLTDTTIYPDDLGDIFIKKGIRVNGGTDVIKASKYISETYGIEYKKVNSDDDLINHLANGYVAMCSVYGGSVFSTGGHIIYLCGYDNGKIQVHDPYLYNSKFNSYGRKGKVKLDGNDVWITNSNWKKYAKSNLKYVFKIPEDKKHGKYQGRVLVDIPIKLTGSYQGDNAQVDSNGYQFWIHKSVIKDNNRIYGLGDICFYAGQDLYMVQIFNQQFWCKEQYLSDKF